MAYLHSLGIPVVYDAPGVEQDLSIDCSQMR
jgi:hypothetical protein